MEPCQSGLTYLFAKEAGASKPLGGSNPPGSATMNQEKIERLIKIFHLKDSILIALTTVSIYFWLNFFYSDLWKNVGMVTNIVGLLTWWTAKLTLAKNWNVGFGKPKINKLVTHGIYSKIRHPMYWGINFTLTGLILLYLNGWFVALCLLTIIYFFNRMRVENDYLSKELGEEYKNYKDRTWI